MTRYIDKYGFCFRAASSELRVYLMRAFSHLNRPSYEVQIIMIKGAGSFKKNPKQYSEKQNPKSEDVSADDGGSNRSLWTLSCMCGQWFPEEQLQTDVHRKKELQRRNFV